MIAPSPASFRRSHTAAKALYFLVFAAIGIFSTFINLYYQNIGLDGTQIGLINTVSPLVGIFSALLGGMLSDRFGKNRVLFVISCLGIILSTWGLAAAGSFPLILLASSGIGLFISPLMSLLDSVTLRLLGDRRDRYGLYRVWGTLGFIVTSTTFGYLMDRWGYGVLFIGYAAIFALFMFAALGLPDQPTAANSLVFKGVKDIIGKPRWILFAVTSFLVWTATTGLVVYLNIFLKDLGSSDQLIGFTMAAAAVSELFIFPFSALWLRKLGSTRLLVIGMIGYVLRMFFFSTLIHVAWGPAVNLLNAVSYAPFFIGSVAYASDVAPQHLKATSQGLLYAIMNLASVLGALVCGWLFDFAGPVQLFRIVAACTLVALVLFAGSQLVFMKKKPGVTI